MSKEDFRKRVLEQKLFDELKDKPLRNADTIRSKVEGYDVDFTRLYTRLVNYQVETYGEQLQCPPRIETYDKDVKAKSHQRKYAKRKYQGLK